MVNGKTVFIEFDSFGQITTSIPLNLWMKPGVNTFGIEVLPENEGDEFNPHSYISATILAKENDNDDSEQIFSIVFRGDGVKAGKAMQSSTPAGRYSSSKKFNPDGGGDILLEEIKETDILDYEGAKIYERDIDIPSSLPLWAFFQSEELPTTTICQMNNIFLRWITCSLNIKRYKMHFPPVMWTQLCPWLVSVTGKQIWPSIWNQGRRKGA